MEWRRTWTKEEAEARESHRTDMARVVQLIARYRDNPMVDADVAPHLVGRRN